MLYAWLSSRAGQDAGEPHPVAVAEVADPGFHLPDEAGVAVEWSGQRAVPVPPGGAGEVDERPDEDVLPLVGGEDSDAEQPAGDGPGRGIDPADAGPGNRFSMADTRPWVTPIRSATRAWMNPSRRRISASR